MSKFILIAIVVYLAISIALVLGSRKYLIESVESTTNKLSLIEKIVLFVYCILVIVPILIIVSIIEVAKEVRKHN